METQIELLADKLGISPENIVLAIVVIGFWELVWNGLSMWRAAQNRSKWWFIIMLLVNDLGVIEILYYFYFSKKKDVHIQEHQLN